MGVLASARTSDEMNSAKDRATLLKSRRTWRALISRIGAFYHKGTTIDKPAP